MVIVDLASRISSAVRVFTLDTGRLPEETYQMMETVRERYGITVEVVFPERAEVEQLVTIHGPNLFYQSVPGRERCCEVRKVRPLERKLETLKAWAAGLRREQSETRAAVREGGTAGRAHQAQSAGGLDGRAGGGVHRAAQGAGASSLRARVHEHRMRAVHAGGRTGRKRARGPLVVGRRRQEGMRHSFCAPTASVRRGQAPETQEDEMHKGFTLWFTGMSGAGKSTISRQLELRLRERGAKVEVLDGDVVRTHLSKGLGFSKEDRDENIRRIGFVCELLSRNGVIAIAAAISPYREVRDEVRARIPNFVEVYVECPVDVLAERDVKGLYKRALAGEIPHFTGISDPYEAPLSPEVTVNSSQETPEESVEKIWATLERLGLVSFDRSALTH